MPAGVDVGAVVGAVIGAGSVITEDVEADALALARGRQVQKQGRAVELRALLSARKGKT